MPIGLGSNAVATNTGASNSTSTSGVATTSGSTMVVAIARNISASVSSVVDNKGNTYTLIAEYDGGAAYHPVAFYYCTNANGGAGHTCTVTLSGSVGCTVFFVEVTGADAASLDSHWETGSSGEPAGVTTGTLAQANELCLCLVNNQGSSSAAQANSFAAAFTLLAETTDGSGGIFTGAIAYKITASTTAVTAADTRTNCNSSWSSMIAAFKEGEAGGGGGGGPSIGARYLMGNWAR